MQQEEYQTNDNALQGRIESDFAGFHPPRPHRLIPGEYFSRSLNCRRPYGLLMPDDEEELSRPLPLLVLLHGLNGKWTSWPQSTRIAAHLAGSGLAVLLPDGGNGWYTNGLNGERWEDDIILDLIPYIENVLPLNGRRAIAGLSMGGYGALKIALKHPDAFPLAISHSGAVDITSASNPNPVFGSASADAGFRRRESIIWLAEQALCRFPSERPQLFLDCGLSDELLAANRSLSEHLNFLGYGHQYREMPGHHTWPYWDRAFRTIKPELLSALRVSAGPVASAEPK